MIFSSKATPQRHDAAAGIGAASATPQGPAGDAGGRRPSPSPRRPRGLLAGALCLALLAGCGGSTSQSEAFVPQRLLVFGDDTSTITASGRKYNVNGLNASGVFDCNLEPIWVQSVAAAYGFAFAECNPSFGDTKAIMLAGAGAEVVDVAAQVEAQIAAGGFRDKDLATVLAGANDIFDLYGQYPGRSPDSLVAEAGARGKQLAAVVNRLVNLGVKVIVSDLPDLGITPYAQAQRALDPSGLDRAALISSLVTAFNEQLGVNVILDGRYVGLVQAQLRFQAIATSPGSFGFADISTPVCTLPLPNCTTATLIPGIDLTQYLWADDRHFTTTGHTQLASLAVARARGNPF